MERERVVTVLGSTYRYLATGDQTAGAYSLVEETFFGDPPPLHVHDDASEAFYVLSGSGTVLVGSDERAVEAGSFVLVPAGVPHTLRRTSTDPLRMLTTMSPAGFERFFLAVTDHPGGEEELGEEGLEALARRYRCRFVG